MFLSAFLTLACSAPPQPAPVPSDAPSTPVLVSDNPRRAGPAFKHFTRFVDANGIGVYGEAGVSDTKLLHVANVIIELLDNRGDGAWDDPEVYTTLVRRQALMPVFTREGSKAERRLLRRYRGEGIAAVLYDDEVDPQHPGHWGRDGTVEEVLHTLNVVGHVAVYPDALGTEPDSSRLTQAMDKARGGQFFSVPERYPDAAWYHYDDETCEYGCMAIEYLYWAQVTQMGLLTDPDICDGISNEWRPCTPALLQQMDPLIYGLVTDPELKLPQKAPTGAYAP